MNETDNCQYLEINRNNPQWQSARDKTRVLLIAINVPGYYSLPVRILSLVVSREKILEGFSIRFLEAANNEASDDLAQLVGELSPDIVGFSVNIWNRELSRELAGIIRQQNPGVKIIAGGQECTNSIENPLEVMPEFDYVIDGEGELSFVEFLRQWHPGSADIREPQSVSGLHYSIQGKPCFSGPASIVKSLDDLPSVILAGLVEPRRNYKLGVMLEGARGCPFHCTYCFEGGSDRKVRSASMARLTLEIEYMVAQGADYFHMMDPVICNSDPERLRSISNLFRKLRARNPNTILLVEAYAQHISEEIGGMLDKGFVVDVGLQTMNPDTAEAVRRKHHPEKFRQGLSRLRKSGATFNMYLICGLPYETLGTFLQGIRFVVDEKPPQLFLNELRLLNGTQLRRQADELGYVYDSNPPYDVFSTPWMSERELKISQALSKVFEQTYNLNGRSVYCKAPWYASPKEDSRGTIIMPLNSPCSCNCSGCAISADTENSPRQWHDREAGYGPLAGKDIELLAGSDIPEVSLRQYAGQLQLASVLRTKLVAPPEFLVEKDRIGRLFNSGIWHYRTFLEAPDLNDPESSDAFKRRIANLKEIIRPIALLGYAVLNPQLDIVLLPGDSSPENYRRAVMTIVEIMPGVITVPAELDLREDEWRNELAVAFECCLANKQWLRLPHRTLEYALRLNDNSRSIMTDLEYLGLVSHAQNRPPCFVEEC
ncbi:MAG: cobalamin-dependent protein [Proteobacteria bacterium]|nr:cobalamin-dependent protein [Pseudomonadota bacterium]MBU1708809.1 cobalamin-dependent protein [Pseudomonadota bacterium]